MKLMCVLRKDVRVGNPNYSGLQFKKFPSDLVHDEVKIEACSKDKSRITLIVLREMYVWLKDFDTFNNCFLANRRAYTEICFVQMFFIFLYTLFVILYPPLRV